MSLLSRSSRRALPILILLAVIALLAIPATWNTRAPWIAIGPSLACAGSPDETLNPPPVPPRPAKKVTNVTVNLEKTADRQRPTFSKLGARDAASTRYIWHVLWRVSLAMAVKH